MRKLSLLKTMLLLCALVAGSMNVWADSSTLTPTSSQIAPSNDHFTVTYGGGGTATKWNSTCVRLYAKNTITFTSKNEEKITQITFTGTVNANSSGKYPGSMSASVGTITPSTISSTGVKDFTWTYATGATEVTLTIGGTAGNIDLTGGEYVVTYTPVSKTDPTITFNDGSVRVGKTLDLSTLFSSNSAGSVTYSITAGGSYASLDGSILTGTSVGSVTVKASQASAGAYNAGEASATITVNAAPTLSSIAVTTVPTKTTYDEGETFDPTGMVVTATYSDASTDNVTALCTWTPSGLLTTSDTEITISYTENGTEKSTTQVITVNAYVQDLAVDMTLNNAFFGTSFGGADAKGSGSHSNTYKRITVNFISGGDKNNFYINDSGIRAYNGNTLEFVAPSGYVITKIVFASAWATGTTCSPTGLSADRKTWADASGAESVAFTPTSRSDISALTVYLAQTAGININSACTDGEGKYYGTYSNNKAFIVPEGLTVSAVSVFDGKLVVTNYGEGDIVKAGTGVMVSSTTAGEKTVILTTETGTEISGNMLKASGDDGITASAMTSANTLFYRLTMHNGSTIGFWWGAADGAAFDLAANKAYLAVPETLAREGFGFDETTGIENVNRETITNNRYYTLDGRRVENPTKGIYIINGKKVVVK